MRKLVIAAAVIAVGSLSVASRASAQAYYPGSNGAPATQGGYYPYPGTYGTYGGYPGTYGAYPSYPQQSSTARDHRRDDDDRYDQQARRDGDHRWRAESRDRYDRRESYRYNADVGVNGAPSRIAEHDASPNRRYQSRHGNWDRDRR